MKDMTAFSACENTVDETGLGRYSSSRGSEDEDLGCIDRRTHYDFQVNLRESSTQLFDGAQGNFQLETGNLVMRLS